MIEDMTILNINKVILAIPKLPCNFLFELGSPSCQIFSGEKVIPKKFVRNYVCC